VIFVTSLHTVRVIKVTYYITLTAPTTHLVCTHYFSRTWSTKNLFLHEAIGVVQNRPICRLMSASGTKHS